VSPRIEAEGLGVRFTFDRQKRPVTPAMARIRRHCSSAWGLRDLNFRVGASESVALVGPNGAGKTTLLRAIAGVFAADEGRISVSGRVGSLLAIEGGLMPALTGRENALLLGVLAGMSRRESRAGLEGIKRRSGLGQSFDRPVSGYSQGMRARLGFSAIEHSRPSVLLLDEVHEALDHEFREHVETTARSIVEDGGIVIAAGHDQAVLERLCRRAFLMKDGTIASDAAYGDVTEHYLASAP